MSQNIIITGIAGFVGSHLADLILGQPGNYTIHGIVISDPNTQAQPNLAHLDGNERLKLYALDMSEMEALSKLVTELRPDYIFHLAARSHIAPSFANPAETLQNNLTSTLNLFEIAKRLKQQSGYNPAILNTGSGDQYGFILPEELPVQENQPFRPGSPYAVSKITQEMLGYQYWRSFGLRIFNTRAFNQLGPRQNPELATATFAHQIALLERAHRHGQAVAPLRVGNLDSSRDYTDVRDMVRGYWMALHSSKCEPGKPYNICSGKDWKISHVLQMLLEHANCPIKVENDPARMRPSDVPEVRGDSSRFREATGWQPQIPLEQSIEDLLNYWRNEVKD
ncbi:GDP-mannose 4,6-dehydratase [Candidatus Chlorohelix sp.]|uniref:GDP-mannose 4,6-dehydratase n=1 Tax=Candidatus Chlorohelix sp. TaxID=3139201 RepID=UPI00303ABF6A